MTWPSSPVNRSSGVGDEELRSDQWYAEGRAMSPQSFHRYMLEEVAAGVTDLPLEIRCIHDGHIRWEYRMRIWAMPYPPWVLYRNLVKFWMRVRLMFLRSCEQCKFDKKNRYFDHGDRHW
jgi:hypothetical protein